MTILNIIVAQRQMTVTKHLISSVIITRFLAPSQTSGFTSLFFPKKFGTTMMMHFFLLHWQTICPRNLGHRWWCTFISGWRETWAMVLVKKDKVSNGFWFKNQNFFYSKSDTWSNQMTGEKWSIAIQMYDLCRLFTKRDIFYCLVLQKQLKQCHKHQDIYNGNLPKKFGSTMMMNFFLRMERNVSHGYNKKGYSLKK